jgi:hypothetical protein
LLDVKVDGLGVPGYNFVGVPHKGLHYGFTFFLRGDYIDSGECIWSAVCMFRFLVNLFLEFLEVSIVKIFVEFIESFVALTSHTRGKTIEACLFTEGLPPAS